MENIKINIYHPFCEMNNCLAQSFYQQYLDYRNYWKQLSKPADFLDNPYSSSMQMNCYNAMLQSAISAVVFEALAIEAYVNFFGAYRLGDNIFYTKYESWKKPYSTIKKIKMLCKDEFKSPYPTNSEHYKTLQALFAKRNKLVHNKPKGYELSLETSNDDEGFLKAMSDITSIFLNLDREMSLYDEVKKNLTAASGKVEPLMEMNANIISTTAQCVAAMFCK